MKKVIIVAALLLIAAVGTNATAQDEEPRTKFYDFDSLMIDGELRAPDLMRTEALDRAQFQRLLDLKKSFLPKVRETSEESALK